MTRRIEAAEVADAIDALHAIAPAASVAALGATSNLAAANITLSTSDTYADADVKTAVDAGINTLRVAVEARLDAIEAKFDDLLAKLKAAEIMDS